jgi:hypothetical protein
MTKSLRLDDRKNIEARRAWRVPRRIVASLAVAATVAAVAFVVDSLRQSVVQLGAVAANVTIEEVGVAPASIEPREPTPLDTSAPSERKMAAELDIEPEPGEPDDWPLPIASGPPSADAFAQLVEAGVLRDVGTDPEAAADLRRALEAAAVESTF